MATVALTIPQAEQTYSGTELDPNYPIMPLSGLTGSLLVLHDLTGSAKADLRIYSSYVTVSGQCLNMAIIINIIFCAYTEVFQNPLT